jgi:hypothetical protein
MGVFLKVIEAVFGGVLAYVICGYVVDALVTGTALSDQMFTLFVPLAIGVGVLIYILGLFRSQQNQ